MCIACLESELHGRLILKAVCETLDSGADQFPHAPSVYEGGRLKYLQLL